MSTNEPEVVHLDPATTAIIRDVVATDELPSARRPSLRDARRADQRAGHLHRWPRVQPIPQPPVRHTADVEVGFPTERRIVAAGGAEPGSLPGGRVARVVHEGAYDELEGAWDRLGAWMSEQGLSFGMPFWEVYPSELSPDMDPADLRTQLNHPVGD